MLVAIQPGGLVVFTRMLTLKKYRELCILCVYIVILLLFLPLWCLHFICNLYKYTRYMYMWTVRCAHLALKTAIFAELFCFPSFLFYLCVRLHFALCMNLLKQVQAHTKKAKCYLAWILWHGIPRLITSIRINIILYVWNDIQRVNKSYNNNINNNNKKSGRSRRDKFIWIH